MFLPIIVVLWEKPNFGGIKRVVVEDVNLVNMDFDKKATSIAIHAGPDVHGWQFPPTVSFVDENSAFMTLAQGGYRPSPTISGTDVLPGSDFTSVRWLRRSISLPTGEKKSLYTPRQ